MKSLTHAKTSIKSNSATPLLLTRVCMHVLGCARTDVRVMREATALVEAGYDVSIVDIESEPTRPLDEDIQAIHVKHVKMPSWYIPTRFKPWFLVKAAHMLIRRTFRLMQVPADVYHAHDVTALPACYIAARLRRKPLIFDAHELPLSQSPLSEMGRRHRWLRMLSKHLLTVILPRCEGIITVSSPIAQEIHRLYHGPEVSLIRNVPGHRIVPKSDRLRHRLGLGPAARIALYQGVLHASRGLEKLVRAAAFLEQDVVIVMMGPGTEETKLQLEALLTKEGVADRVKILPAVPYVELLAWTASADLGLIIYAPDYSPNVRMCLPNKLFEYLMAGLPVLASPLEAVAEVINTYEIGRIVSSLEPVDIGAAINAMLSDHAALEQMRQNALGAARYEFNWERERQRLVQLYRNILRTQTSEGTVLEQSVH